MKKALPIYLDYAATTPVDPRVFDTMRDYFLMDGCFGNASSVHYYGQQANRAIETARASVARFIGVDPAEIIFTSGATESNNLAIKGIAAAYAFKGNHIITSLIEHPSILKTCQQLEKNGHEVTYLKPLPDGRIDLHDLKNALSKKTILITLAHVNSEIGVIQDIEAIASVARDAHVLLHIDAAQSAGKIPIDLKKCPVDLLSLSAHKYYGPKGVGALYIKPLVRVMAQSQGGDQEQGLRSGTLATHQIVGMGKACDLASAQMNADYQRIQLFRDQFEHAVRGYEQVFINSDREYCLPHIFNISVANIDTQWLWLELSKKIAASSGSACAAHRLEPSPVLQAIGRNKHLSSNGVRISLGRFTTQEEVDVAISSIKMIVAK